jgi:hypothetical protein
MYVVLRLQICEVIISAVSFIAIKCCVKYNVTLITDLIKTYSVFLNLIVS